MKQEICRICLKTKKRHLGEIAGGVRPWIAHNFEPKPQKCCKKCKPNAYPCHDTQCLSCHGLQPQEDNTPLGIAEKGVRIGKDWFDAAIKRDIPSRPEEKCCEKCYASKDTMGYLPICTDKTCPCHSPSSPEVKIKLKGIDTGAISLGPEVKECEPDSDCAKNGWCLKCNEKLNFPSSESWENEFERIFIGNYIDSDLTKDQARDVKDFIRKIAKSSREEGYRAGIEKAKYLASWRQGKEVRNSTIKEIMNEIVELRKEFANTPIKDRGTGWDWLGKVYDKLQSLTTPKDDK